MLHRTPSVLADLVRPAGATGSLRYTESYTCPGPVSGWKDWTVAKTPHLAAPCARPLAWHVAAGWLDHPVVQINLP